MIDPKRKPPLHKQSAVSDTGYSLLPEKWKTLVGLALMVAAALLGWNWFWAGLIILGVVYVIYAGEIHFVEEVNRWDNPKLFWFMVVVWSVLAAYSIATLYV